jgi:tetratricopeptide (TPR) repeat protein
MHSASQIFNLALQYHQGGNLQQAEVHYRQILQIDPQHADALHMIGLLAHQVGRNDVAVDYIQHALRLRPDSPAAHNNLGIALRNQGRLDEAIAAYHQAVRLKPDFADAYYNLGNALKDQGNLDEAIASYQQSLRLKPNYAEAFNNLGSALRDQGKLEEALACAQHVVNFRPNSADAHNNLGNALRDLGKFDEAITSHQQALRLKPDFAEAYNNLGNALKDQGKLDEAITSYQHALRLRPNAAGAHNNLGNTLTDQGKVEEAVASYREALRLKPDFADALGQLASLLRGQLPDVDRAILEQRLAEPDLNDTDRVKLLFGLAEVCDAKGEYPQAAAVLRQANALSLSLRRQKGQAYDPNENARFVDNLMTAFTPAFFERVRSFGLDTERPMFIVGLPRSGTTLTEQILAAHSHVYGAGELTLARDDFLSLGTKATNECAFADLPELSGDAFHRLAERHLSQLATMNGTAARVVDKMPDNYFYLGLLAALFPNAKFIHCRRDLRDVAVSCWMTNFSHFNWAHDPESIVARFREYQRLMAHWRTVLPIAVLEVRYEETVADLPGQARRLVEWCGLTWEPACLKFNESHKAIRTASKLQVREPVYTRSVARWRNYERELSELFAALKPLLD